MLLTRLGERILVVRSSCRNSCILAYLFHDGIAQQIDSFDNVMNSVIRVDAKDVSSRILMEEV